jgi:Skp family chaperone for outer membrane proteins
VISLIARLVTRPLPEGAGEDGVKSLKTSAVRGAALAVAAFVIFSTQGRAQVTTAAAAAPDTAGAVRDLQDQVRQLRDLVEQMRAENAQSRAEMQKLRQDLQATRALLEQPSGQTENPSETSAESPSQTPGNGAGTSASAPSASVSQGNAALEQRVEKLEESTSLIGSKVDEQYQTKVETASKYRARLHGIVMMNAFRNVGASDDLDFPDFAQPVAAGSPTATLGATLRQSELGLEIFGPTVAGAKTSADVQLDFAGGFPATGNGVNFGIVRLQTASLRFDWDHTSVIAGQDSLFVSPLSPTSFASLATPAFAFAGNLWGWTPQLRVEHRFSIGDQQQVTMQAGVLDNLDWEYPTNPFYRSAQAGEMSGQPAYGFRTAWSRPIEDHPLSFGVAGYYGRQDWTWARFVDAWSGMADWQIPILPRLSLSGEFYRGRGIGGLGGAIGTSIVYGGNPTYSYSPIRGLDTAGGWTQLKFQLTPKIELNGVIAQDDAFTDDIRGFATDQNNGGLVGSILGRNRGALGNIVFRPRSDLILAAELRRLRTFPVYSFSSVTNQINLSMGILF